MCCSIIEKGQCPMQFLELRRRNTELLDHGDRDFLGFVPQGSTLGSEIDDQLTFVYTTARTSDQL
ncbi:hypothetical protein Y013_12720 [Rhodococcus pyridinivorans SB3094]|uniref:Uncharacterized protein n=1 Tax=Rhodococcus pyridinivorans SB3094 TaxID=1435356 RepID=V9XQW4_9NOCA|nr:hypothetical protein Y013_12720 [Rhodococcus pyridinivorans SB3094]